ncbi:cytochrome c peroxidase [Chitinophaga sp. YIM B06452]|uniref:cytochrome-c peroxidase n=1 Tax=Chitinophaga sp. YIM B06452 TaxID=3082158 RepID=UPI0031FED7C0
MANGKQLLITVSLALTALAGSTISWNMKPVPTGYADSLRQLYARPTAQWPKPDIDSNIVWKELGLRPNAPVAEDSSLKPMAELGRQLFFDPRLSGSNQISCGSCHEPELGWTNGRSTAVGHDHRTGERNVPTLLNVWATTPLFWDGRVKTLEDQALSPIGNEVEMHQGVDKLPSKLSAIPGYKKEFSKIFGAKKITEQQIATALATFQRTIQSRSSRFDAFLQGREKALSDLEIEGLHLFRTKARCMNCHNGPLFTDNKFHNIGLTYYKRKYEDLGLYNVTRKPEDVGKFKTPGLRDIVITRPYMHVGLFDDLEGVINIYNAGGGHPRRKKTPEEEKDPLYPVTSSILRPLGLTPHEKEALVAFLHAISTTSYRISRPELPQ